MHGAVDWCVASAIREIRLRDSTDLHHDARCPAVFRRGDICDPAVVSKDHVRERV